MINNVLKRPALGQVAALGSLYDARSDSFIPLSLLRSAVPSDAVDATDKHSTDIKFSNSETYKDKFDRFSIQAELSASFLAGLVSVEGSGRYLSEKRDNNLVLQASMHYNISTLDEELNLICPAVKKNLAFKSIDTDLATHVVVGISWGAQCVITAKYELAESENKTELQGNLAAELNCLKFIATDVNGGMDLDVQNNQQKSDRAFEVTVYGDVLADDGLVPTDFASAQKFVKNIQKYISKANAGKGKPLVYTLLPLNMLSMFRILEVKADIICHQLSVECLEKFVQLFDDMTETQLQLSQYYSRVCKHRSCVPEKHIEAVSTCLSNARANEAALKSSYAQTLQDVRSGRTDSRQLWELFQWYNTGERSPKSLLTIAAFGSKMDFVDVITSEGARFVGYFTSTVDNEIALTSHNDAYVFYFNQNTRDSSDLWNDNYSLLLELMRDRRGERLILVVDCDATGQNLEKPNICLMRNGRIIVQDVLEQRKALADNCILRYNDKAIDLTVNEKPLSRRAVKMPCPGPHCDRMLKCHWICGNCQVPVEYGHVNDRLYCNCGVCDYDQWEFRCKDPKHGSTWYTYEKGTFLNLLKKLEPFEELNLLILGETGVGKSTWINAFTNYLTHDTLEDALETEDLKWVIPCSFSTQTKDDGGERNESKRFIQKHVQIGYDKNERDGSAGKSATKLTNVYAVDIWGTRVRLIDTPGIGDTKGIQQDNENMADILRVLRSYNKLHGIIILLKPNAPRLTVMFRFCIKQLLTHLHRDAAENIVFGFTNTRGSNYKPGDTFKPLEALLNEYEEVKMGLFEHNVYCFDSESFRYLAARKKGIDMGLQEDNSRSWDYSVEECKRLVKHFKSINPHEVRGTINLNETRNVILQLTQPMALIAQKIQATIEINEDEIAELKKAKLTKEELQKKLYVPIESLESFAVDQPRTVCANKDCTEIRTGLNGVDEFTIIYKTFCHRPCYIQGVDANKKGHHLLQDCWAIGSGGKCRGCGHHWMDHMHMYSEYRPKTYKMVDKTVEKDLGEKATRIELQQDAIRMREIAIQEFKLEYAHVQETAVQFGFFLKRHAINAYNDATLEYLDHLIEQEKMKVEAGGKLKRLETLQQYRNQHVEKVKVLKAAMDRGDNQKLLDDKGVYQAVRSLYALNNFGKDLKDIVKTNEKAAEACYREKSFNVSAGAHWNRKRPKKLEIRPNGKTGTQRGPNFAPSTFNSDHVPGSFPEDYVRVHSEGYSKDSDNVSDDERADPNEKTGFFSYIWNSSSSAEKKRSGKKKYLYFF